MNLTEGPLLRQLVIFSLPLIGSMLLQLTFHAADLVVVGHYASSDAMAAVGSTGSIMILCINLLFGISSGAAVLSAQYYGAKDYRRLGTLIHTAMYFAILGGIVVAVAGQFFSYPVLRWMRSPENVIGKSTLYMCICLAGTPFQMIYIFGSSIMRSLGDTKRPMYFLAFSGLVNVILNVFFVVCFHLSVAGVALATIISHAISACLVWKAMSRYDSAYRLLRHRLKIDRTELKKLLRIGIPSGIQGSFFSLSNVVIQSSINSLGSLAMAGNAATVSIEGMVYAGCNCFFHAALTFGGQNFGAKNYKRIVKSFQYCCLLTMIASETLGFVFLGFGRSLLSIYNSDPEVIQWGMQRMYILFTTYGFCGLMDVASGGLRGLGYSVFPSVTIFFSVCAMRVVWCWIVFRQFHSMNALMYSYPISWFLAAAVNLAFLYFVCVHHIKPKLKQT